MRARLKPANLIKIGVSLIVLAIVVQRVGADNLLDALRRIDMLWFAAALAIHLLGIVVRAYRWSLLIASLGAPVPFGRLLYLYFVGNFFNTFLPTGIGGDVVKIIELAPERGGVVAFSTVFVDRLTGILGSSLIALAAVVTLPGDVPPEIQTLVVVVSGGIVFATLALTQGKYLDRLIWRSRFFSNLPFAGKLHKVYAALTFYSVGAITRATLVSFPFTLTLIATQVALARALGLDIDARYFVIFTPIVALAQVLPISLNGLGIREGAFAVLFSSVGVAPSDAVAMSLLYQLLRALTGLLGGVLYIIGNLRGKPAAQPTDTPERETTRQPADSPTR
jgi:uncharacterized protein (TIRG00374 family)